MSFKLWGFVALSVLLYASAPVQAGVLRTEAPADTPITATTATAAVQLESTTVPLPVGEEVAISRDEDATVKIAVASLDPAPGTIEGIEITLDTVDVKKEESKQSENSTDKPAAAGEQKEEENNKQESESKPEVALSRDAAASVQIKSHEAADLAKEAPVSNAETLPVTPNQKSSKLLLLSTPRLAREQEENIAEPEDVDINTAVSTDDTTELSVEVQSAHDAKSSEENEEHSSEQKPTTEEPTFLTRVRDAIFGKNEEVTKPVAPVENKVEQKSNDDALEKDKAEIKKDEETALPAAAEHAPEPHNDNSATAVLVETEADYVLVDTDVEHLGHLGSFTHADSAEYLQPIVHSVEVVPSHFEEPLLFTSGYVHAW